MANIKVSEMTEATSFDDGDYTMIVQANQNKKISHENILGNIENNISTINTNIGNLSNLETTDITNIVNSINSLMPKILWTNPNPTSSFSAQTITLNSSDYDMYEVLFYGSETRADTMTSGRIPKGENAFLQQVYHMGDGSQTRNRSVKYVSDISLNITEGTINGNSNNTQNIPIYIIGYKTGLFNNEGE